MEVESNFTTVNIVKKLIEQKTQKLHELLDERKAALNEELDTIEQGFKDANETDKKDLEKWSAYKDQTLDLFNDEWGVDVQLSRIEYRIKTLNERIDLRKVRLDWDDTNVRRGLTYLGVLVSSETHGTKIYEPLEISVNYEVIDEDLMSEQPATPDRMSGMDRIRIPSRPTEYIKPLREAPKAPSKTPPRPPISGPSPCMLPIDGGGGHKKSLVARTKSVENVISSTQESELYCKVPDQKPVWHTFHRKKSASVGDKINITGVSTQHSRDLKVISKATLGSGPGQILKPKGVAVSTKTGCIFVVEKGNNRIQVFAPTGDAMYSFGKRARGVPFVKPYGICILDEKVYVSLTHSNCIMVFKTNGEYCAQVGQEGKGTGCLNFPTGLCTEETNIYVCDCGNNRVQVLTCNLIFKQVFGVGKLTNPMAIAFDTNSNFFVVLDRSTTVVHIFNMKGVYQRKIINVSKFPTLSNPLFITISPVGNIVLSDLLTCSVNIFTMEGQLIRSLGGLHEKDTFGEPRGITCDTLGRLVVVCNKEQGCLQIIDFSS